MSDETPITVTVLYPMDADGRFDHEYYMAKHIPLVQARWQPLGLTGIQILRGTPGPDGMAPAFRVIALVRFSSMAACKAAGAQHGAEIFGDIPNFTDAKPVVQVNDMVL